MPENKILIVLITDDAVNLKEIIDAVFVQVASMTPENSGIVVGPEPLTDIELVRVGSGEKSAMVN